MDWLFDNLQILIAVGAGVAYWLNQRKEAEAEQEQDAGFEPRDPAAVEDAARARKIREEIRRKIAERSGGPPVFAPQTLEEPPPYMQTEFERPMPVDDPYAHDEWRDEPAVPAGPSAEELAVLERQRLLDEKLRELDETRAQTKTRVAAVKQARKSGANSARRSLQEDLRNTSNLRRAIVLREVLGPPVSMR